MKAPSIKPRVMMWARVRLGAERLVDVARELGYWDGSSVLHGVKRLERRAPKDEAPELLVLTDAMKHMLFGAVLALAGAVVGGIIVGRAMKSDTRQVVAVQPSAVSRQPSAKSLRMHTDSHGWRRER